MTTDPFADAARAEAERRHPAPEIETGAQLGYTQTQIREVVRRTFTNAAEWARAHLAVQEPTDAEKAVRELHAPRCHGMRDREGNPVDSCDHCYGPDGYNATYPCPTIQALDSARAARRDEEKR